MGECNYYLKAQFGTEEEAVTALKGLIKLVKAIERASPRILGRAGRFLKEFFTISKMASIWIDPDEHEDYLPDCNLGDEPYVAGNVLYYMACVSHITSWGRLCNYMEKKFNAIKVVCATEEDGYNMDSLHLYEWEEIVKALLKKKDILPLLLNAHNDLDALISLTLKE